MREVIIEFQAVLNLSFLCLLLLVKNIRPDLLKLSCALFERLAIRPQSPAVKHAALCEVVYNHRYALNIPIPDDEVVPLMVRFGVAISPDIQVVLLVLLSHVLEVAILEVGLESKGVLRPALDHLVVVVDEARLVVFYELARELFLELLVDEN